MTKISLLFGAPQALTLRCLVLFFIATAILGSAASPFGLMFLYALLLGLFVGGGDGISLGLGFGSLFGLFALGFGIVGVP